MAMRASKWVVVSVTLAAAAVSLHATAQAPPASPATTAPDAPSLDAQLARSTAVESARAGRWADALRSADEAVRLAPRWTDAYFVRAGIHHGIGGAPSELAALKTYDVKIDYTAMAASLRACAADLEQYLKLAGSPADGPAVIQQIGKIRTRLSAVDEHRNTQLADAKKQLAEAKEIALGKVRLPSGLICWPEQFDSAGKCTGPPKCPEGHEQQDVRCVLRACTQGRVRAQDGVHCCWSGQTWTNGCEGPASCPAGTEPRPDLGLACFPKIHYYPEPDKAWRKSCKEAKLPAKSTMLSWTPLIYEYPDRVIDANGERWDLDRTKASSRDGSFDDFHERFASVAHDADSHGSGDGSRDCPALDGWFLARHVPEAKGCRYGGYSENAKGDWMSLWCCP